jgi:hypothetical protein
METMGWREAWAVAQAMIGPWPAWGLLASVALLVLLLAWSVLSGRRLRWRWVGRFAALLGAAWTVAGLAWATGVPLTGLVAGGTDLLVLGAAALAGGLAARLLGQILFARRRL